MNLIFFFEMTGVIDFFLFRIEDEADPFLIMLWEFPILEPPNPVAIVCIVWLKIDLELNDCIVLLLILLNLSPQ